MFHQILNNIEDILSKDPGCKNEIDNLEQISWLLFLKFIDDIEKARSQKANLSGLNYEYIIAPKYRWDVWAAPKAEAGSIDSEKALTGEKLIDFVNLELFPYLMEFREASNSPESFEYMINEIFSEFRNKIHNAQNLKEVINLIDQFDFIKGREDTEFRNLYENKLSRMSTSKQYSFGYYTLRPLIKAIIKVINPQLGETIYDGALGSAGLLCEAYEYLIDKYKYLTPNQEELLRTKTFYGKEKRRRAYLIGVLNMILHGIESPNISPINTLMQNLQDINEEDCYDIIISDPLLGGIESPEVRENFPIKTDNQSYLFLQHYIKMLKPGGRACVVFSPDIIFGMDDPSISIRRLILDDCNLHTILFLNLFTVLFFEKGSPTKKIWYYKMKEKRFLYDVSPFDKKEFIDWLVRISKVLNNKGKFRKSHFSKYLLHLYRKLDEKSVFTKDDFEELLLNIEDNIEHDSAYNKEDLEELKLSIKLTPDNYGLLGFDEMLELRFNLNDVMLKKGYFNYDEYSKFELLYDISSADNTPLNDNDFAEFLKLQLTKGESKYSSTVHIAEVDTINYDIRSKKQKQEDEEFQKLMDNWSKGVDLHIEEANQYIESVNDFLKEAEEQNMLGYDMEEFWKNFWKEQKDNNDENNDEEESEDDDDEK